MRRQAWLFVAAALLGGCAEFGARGDGAISPEEARLQAIEGRLSELTRRTEGLSQMAQGQDRQRLEAEVRSLRGEVEKLRHDVESTQKRSQDLYRDLDRRLQKIESEKQPARLSLDPRMSGAPAAPPSQEEEATYLRVFEQLKAGRYDDAISGFESQLERWPQGRYADNALYWTGESYYVKRDFEAAINSFGALLGRFPASPKVPDALLKIGLAQAELKRTDDARATFNRVIQEHPGSNAANLARQRLSQLQ